MQYAICEEHFSHRPLSETVSFLSDLGYEALEITPWTVFDRPREPTDDELVSVRETVESASLEVAGIPRIFAADETAYQVCSPDTATRRRTVEALCDVVDACAALGGSVVVFGSPAQRTVPDSVSDERAWDNALAVFGDPTLLARLERHGIDLCMEPLSRPYTDFITSAAEAIRFAREVDHPRVGVALDGFHLAREAEPIETCLREAGSLLRSYHCDGDTGRGPAHGSLDYVAILDTLEEIGYDGSLMLEIHELLFADAAESADADAAAIAEESITYLRSLRE